MTDQVLHALEVANQRLIEAENLMDDVENHQRKLIDNMHRLVHQIALLNAELDNWKARADEMERDRNRWQARAGEMEDKYRAAARRAAKLGLQTGEARCPNCGSSALVLLSGSFPTGVFAPDGGAEQWYECALDCQECGHREELVP